jgi:hypothetical protein
MSSNIALWFGIFLLLSLGGTIGWILCRWFYDSAYEKLLNASIEVNKVTIRSLEESMKELKRKKENNFDAERKN